VSPYLLLYWLVAMESDWKKDFAYNMRAFGSNIFYLAVIVRAIIGDFPNEIFLKFSIWLAIAIVLFYISKLFMKNIDGYAARGTILSLFLSIYYKNLFFAMFAAAIMIGLVASRVYLKIEKKSIAQGVITGIVATGIAYYLVSLVF